MCLKNQSISIFFISSFLMISLISACQESELQPNFAKEPFLLGGIQVNEPNQEKWLSVLEDVGMNTVSITIYARNGDWNLNFLKSLNVEDLILLLVIHHT